MFKLALEAQRGTLAAWLSAGGHVKKPKVAGIGRGIMPLEHKLMQQMLWTREERRYGVSELCPKAEHAALCGPMSAKVLVVILQGGGYRLWQHVSPTKRGTLS